MRCSTPSRWRTCRRPRRRLIDSTTTHGTSDAILGDVTSQTIDREPACPEAGPAITDAARPSEPRLRAEPRAVADIPPSTWDALAARAPWATPFSSWAFHRAWWDAYAANAHEETVVVVRTGTPADGSAEPVAIVPLMHRHEVEPSDALTHTTMRHGADADLTAVAPDATAVFFGASYHADYATILSAPDDLPAVAEAVAPISRRIARVRGTRSTFEGCGAATPPRRRWRRPSAPVR